MNFRKTIIFVLPMLFLLPVLAFSAESLFVKCDGVIVKCDFNYLIIMVNAILNWFIGIAFVLAAIGMTYSGAKIVMAAGKPEELSAARSMFWSILYGTLWVAGAWLVVYTIMEVLTRGNSSGFNFLKYLK